MNIQEIQTWINENSEIGSDLEKAAKRVPQLQAQAINMRANETGVLKVLELDLISAKKNRWIYYSGKADANVYKDEPFELKVLKSDMDIFLDSDKEVLTLQSKIENQKIKVQMLTDFLYCLNQRTFLIRSINETLRIQQGLV